jgi:hypothetical protein
MTQATTNNKNMGSAIISLSIAKKLPLLWEGIWLEPYSDLLSTTSLSDNPVGVFDSLIQQFNIK